MKSLSLTIVFILAICFISFGQNHVTDSLVNALKTQKEDTGRVNTLIMLASKLQAGGVYDSSLAYSQKAIKLAGQLGYKKGLADANIEKGTIYDEQGDYSHALESYNTALSIYREIGNKKGIASSLGNMGNMCKNQGDYAKALDYDQKALAIDQEMGDTAGIARKLGNIGNIYDAQGDYIKALDFDLKALYMYVGLDDQKGIARNMGNIGIVYSEQGNYPKALDYFFKALTITKKIQDKAGISNNLSRIGTIYDEQGDQAKALEFDTLAMNMAKEMGDKNVITSNLVNIGIIYEELNDYNKALDYELKALAINTDMGDKMGIAYNLGSISVIYYALKNYPKALEYQCNALALNRETGNKYGMADCFCCMGNIYVKQKKYAMAKAYLDSALVLSMKIGEKDFTRESYLAMAQLDSATGNYKAALEDFKKFVVYRDSLVNEANTKKSVQEQMNYDFEQKQAAEKAEQDKKDAVALQERKKQNVIRNSFIAGFALMLALAFFIFRGYRQKQKANEVITQQKEEVEKQKTLVEQQKALVDEKNKDILDSIIYAKRLQDAILPPFSLIKQYLPESFVMYKPKDIVAGDFYWFEKMGDTIFIAAADCTGHGVPGALVSVVCSNALNRTVKEFRITEPGKILDKVRELVLETFEKSESNVQDGMDISLAAISYKPLASSFSVQWSGAYNSLWYIQNNARPDAPFGRELKEVAADKQPIGKADRPIPFNTHNLKLQKGDTLYLFTDGYADQFGGPKGKKFKYAQFSEKLKTISHESMEEQKNILEKTFDAWKGNLEQVDDVLVIGVSV
jgi:tetratricopeptide (TPR) repeat protein